MVMRAQRHKGISLLETLLVLVVAAVIVTGSVMYYSHAVATSRVAQASTLIQQINKAGYEWLQIPNSTLNPSTLYPKDFSSLANVDNGLTYFNDAKLLPCENNSCFTNPWGGTVTATVTANYPQYMLIVLTKLPDSDCALLRQQLVNIAPQNVTSQNICTSSKGVSTYQVYL
jgi:type II secretory pathway pseudopilin PulG